MDKKNRRIPVLQPTFGDTDWMCERFRELFASGRVTLGDYTRNLEEAAGRFLEVEHVVAVSSCTSGLMLALKALGISGEVILPSFTFAATAHAVTWCGLRPVFCDCEEDTLSLDLNHAARLVNENSSALLPVYIFGAPPDWRKIGQFAEFRNLRLVADAAQGLGATYRGKWAGGFGDVEIFSMSPTKVVTAGEGGLVATGDPVLAKEIRSLRDYGKAEDGEDMRGAGLSARMSEFHAVIALENFRHLKEWTAARRRIIERYRRELEGIPGFRYPALPAETDSSWNYMVLLVDEDAPVQRDDLHRGLRQRGIQTKRYFFPPVHRLEVYRRDPANRNLHLPMTDRVSARALALPLFTHMTDADVLRVAGAIRSLCRR